MQSTLYCPKCSGELVPLRRSGLVIDRCSACGGVFLDRGELEKLIAIERQDVRPWDDDDDDDFYERNRERDRGTRDYDDRDRPRKRKSRKRSFFEELFDID